jgi:hypothetical protein
MAFRPVRTWQLPEYEHCLDGVGRGEAKAFECTLSMRGRELEVGVRSGTFVKEVSSVVAVSVRIHFEDHKWGITTHSNFNSCSSHVGKFKALHLR